VVARNTLGEKEFDKFITYKAKSAVAREHGYESAIEMRSGHASSQKTLLVP